MDKHVLNIVLNMAIQHQLEQSQVISKVTAITSKLLELYFCSPPPLLLMLSL